MPLDFLSHIATIGGVAALLPEANLTDTVLWQPTAVLTYFELLKEDDPISMGQGKPSGHTVEELVKVEFSRDKERRKTSVLFIRQPSEPAQVQRAGRRVGGRTKCEGGQ